MKIYTYRCPWCCEGVYASDRSPLPSPLLPGVKLLRCHCCRGSGQLSRNATGQILRQKLPV